MRHASDAVLRRLVDEPFAVPDATFEHVSGCRRCRARRADVAGDAGQAGRLLTAPQLVADVDLGWEQLGRRLEREGGVPSARPAARRRRVATRISGRAGIAAGVAVFALVGTAAATTIDNVFAPTHVASLTINQDDLRMISGLVDFSESATTDGFPTAAGSGSLPFGTLHWSSVGAAQKMDSLAAAEAVTGLRVTLPTRLPKGVGAPTVFTVQPKVSATIDFGPTAGHLSGSSIVVTAGPAVFVGYGSRAGDPDVPTLAVLDMSRPTATARGATIAQIEAFLLSQPGVPAALAEEIKLLGDITTVLPVPTPAGMVSHSVQVGGAPAVAVATSSGLASGVVWEDAGGIVHVVGGLVDQRSTIDVADQIG
ncbi:MAG TPA: hypothetical protein VG435_18320 [Acidimicrobiales bacterium]|jgi:hypothetical protein|nr:hypothetical protein [Acidimicrobiales bacterium]